MTIKRVQAREKAAREAEKRRQDAETPTPGSIAATERDQANANAGPKVVADDDDGMSRFRNTPGRQCSAAVIP